MRLASTSKRGKFPRFVGICKLTPDSSVFSHICIPNRMSILRYYRSICKTDRFTLIKYFHMFLCTVNNSIFSHANNVLFHSSNGDLESQYSPDIFQKITNNNVISIDTNHITHAPSHVSPGLPAWEIGRSPTVDAYISSNGHSENVFNFNKIKKLHSTDFQVKIWILFVCLKVFPHSVMNLINLTNTCRVVYCCRLVFESWMACTMFFFFPGIQIADLFRYWELRCDETWRDNAEFRRRGAARVGWWGWMVVGERCQC